MTLLDALQGTLFAFVQDARQQAHMLLAAANCAEQEEQ